MPEKEFEPNPQDSWDEEDHPIPVPEADAVDAKGTPINTSSLANTLINAEFVLPHGESENLARVIRRPVDKYGIFIVNYNEDPILNTESFQLQMVFSFPFLRANDLRSSLLNIRARSFLLSCT